MRLGALPLLLIVILFGSSNAYAYSPDTTHRGLTRDTIRLFNYYSKNKISEAESLFIEQGSVDEDVHTRPLNHFYDPIYNRGMNGGVTSKLWAVDTVQQARFGNSFGSAIGASHFGSITDYSWERAIYEYVHGDRERAFETLGHVIHLIQDVSVPDHTRNDAHPPLLDFGSPYEAWTSKFDTSNIFISQDLIKVGINVPSFSSLNEYFDNLAGYSNRNFFSKDTIKNTDYDLPKLVYVTEIEVEGELYGILQGSIVSDKKDYLFRIDVAEGGSLFTLTDDLVMSSYWNALSREAVLHGAGVLSLFFEEVEREKESLALLKKNESAAEKALANVFTPLKDIMTKLFPAKETTQDESNNSAGEGSVGGEVSNVQEQIKQKPIVGELLPSGTEPPIQTGPTLEQLQAQVNQASALIAFLKALLAEHEAKREAECMANSIRGPWDNFWWTGDKPGCEDPTPKIQKLFWAPIQGAGGGGEEPVADGILGPIPEGPPGVEEF